ncbi:hypothetical protein EA472_11660 [Natrarchaeobius oligotrophus]|uniref:Uncharacterized protein n=1 Tax=Natrarchaeobius chitinivorans TaxID=1679083 RepID=A0A3N6PN31_NATCH|nr:hypothetical protein EA472_11660 [Natrarchaeobius chitinivorans]
MASRRGRGFGAIQRTRTTVAAGSEPADGTTGGRDGSASDRLVAEPTLSVGTRIDARARGSPAGTAD